MTKFSKNKKYSKNRVPRGTLTFAKNPFFDVFDRFLPRAKSHA
jgi:hypothetical protein